MTSRILLGVAATLLLCVPAIAQDASVGISQQSEQASEVGPANAGPLDAQITGDNTYGAVVAAINAQEAVDLSAISAESNISIVLVSTLEGDAAAEGQALDAALSDHRDALATLRTGIGGTPAITDKLTAEGHSVDDVIAIRTDANGNVLVFVDDRAK